MTPTGPPLFGAEADWTHAERVAAKHREQRMHPNPRRQRRNRVLAPVAAVCWVVAVVFALAGLLTPGDAGYELEFASYGGLVLFPVFGGWWLTSTGRYMIRGSATSIRAAIPPAAQKQVRRHLALREPLDPQHQEVVLELAHQGRNLLGGQVALFAFYVPLYLTIAHNSHDWVITVVLAFGTVGLLTGAIFLIVANQRLTHLIQQNQHTESVPGPSRANG